MMADITNVFNAGWMLIALLHGFLLNCVYADYCEFGLCENEQYCCGNNKCCNKTLDLWFFWAGIFLVIFALAVAAGVRYNSNRRNKQTTYLPLATQPTTVHDFKL